MKTVDSKRGPINHQALSIELRKKLGITQSRLAEMIGAHRSAVSHVETGRSRFCARYEERFMALVGTDQRKGDDMGKHGMSIALSAVQWADVLHRLRKRWHSRGDVAVSRLNDAGIRLVAHRDGSFTLKPPPVENKATRALLEVVEEVKLQQELSQEQVPVAAAEQPPQEEPKRELALRAELVPFAVSDGQVIDLLTVKSQNGQVWAMLFRLCEALELEPQHQIEKCRERDDWLTGVIACQLSSEAQARSVFCIAVQDIPNWLNSINRNRVSERARPALVKLQAECTEAIRRHYGFNTKPPQGGDRFVELLLSIQQQNAISQASQDKTNQLLAGTLAGQQQLMTVLLGKQASVEQKVDRMYEAREDGVTREIDPEVHQASKNFIDRFNKAFGLYPGGSRSGPLADGCSLNWVPLTPGKLKQLKLRCGVDIDPHNTVLNHSRDGYDTLRKEDEASLWEVGRSWVEDAATCENEHTKTDLRHGQNYTTASDWNATKLEQRLRALFPQCTDLQVEELMVRAYTTVPARVPCEWIARRTPPSNSGIGGNSAVPNYYKR